MNYSEALPYLRQLGREAPSAKFSLKTIRRLCRAFENPQNRFSSVLIAGTNGKGSTAATLYAILLQTGIPVGCYISPHLVHPRERIRVHRSCISEEDFARCLTEVRDKVQWLNARRDFPIRPSFFEVLTMAAFIHFARSGVRLAVLEVGLGGRLDATNLCQPEVVALTGISRDHQQYLGNSLMAIAREKTGTFRTGIPAVVGDLPPRIMRWVARRAGQIGAPVWFLSRDSLRKGIQGEAGRYRFEMRTRVRNYPQLAPSLRGRHQVHNAGLAVLLAERLSEKGWPIDADHIRRGLSGTIWPGRLQWIDGEPAVLLDGAHNPEGAAGLASFLESAYPRRRRILVFGAMRDKNYGAMARLLFPRAEKIVLTRPRSPRAVSLKDLMALPAARCHPGWLAADDPARALQEAIRLARPEDLLVVTGSLFLVGEILSSLGYDTLQPFP